MLLHKVIRNVLDIVLVAGIDERTVRKVHFGEISPNYNDRDILS